jgi:poly(beta-D-mannuronate) lyase
MLRKPTVHGVRLGAFLGSLFAVSALTAVTLSNPGFESDFSGWTDTDPSAISTSDVHSGSKAAKITGSAGRVEQTVSVTANTDYVLSAWIYEKGTIGVEVGSTTYSDSGDYDSYTEVSVNFNSGSQTSIEIFAAYNGGTGRFDDFTLVEDSSGGGGGSDLDFSSLSSTAYGNNGGSYQDGSGTVQSQDSGATFYLSGNRWRDVPYSYTVTADTVLEFDFKSTDEAEIQAIGFDNNDNQEDALRALFLYGSQGWNNSYDDQSTPSFPVYTGAGDWETYVVYIGQFYTGSFDRIFFVNDGDSNTGNSYFRNVSVYEDTGGSSSVPAITTGALPDATVGTAYSHTLTATGGDAPLSWSETSGNLPSGLTLGTNGVLSSNPSTAGTYNLSFTVTDDDSDTDSINLTLIVVSPSSGTIDFSAVSDSAYGNDGGSYQDGSGTAQSQDSGATYYLSGNRWRDIAFNYTVTSDTILEFDFRSTDEAEIQAIGFDSDDDQENALRAFFLYGSQGWNNSYDDLSTPSVSTYSGGGSWVTYSIPVGDFYTGTFDRLFFVNDGDSNTGNSYFRNVKVYEDGANPNIPAITTTSLPDATVDTSYSQTLTASGGNGTLTWSVGSGLPSGVSLSSSGVLSGTPTATGTYNFTVTVTDSDSDSDNQALTLEVVSGSSGGLDPNAAPGENFDLSTWKITFPDASEEKEDWLVGGGESAGEFFTDSTTGGMVFRCPNDGGSTGGSSYSRTELREMLRAGNTSISTTGLNANNWVFSNSSTSSQNAAGGVDGTLSATLTVDHVSTTGDSGKVGRVIVGQIHASNDEPCRLYYRKLPGNSKGSIYFAHEPATGSEQWYEMIGSRSDSASNPSDGIELGELWSYIIDVDGDTLTVTIIREGKSDVVETVDMSSSGFEDDWMYFKAGVYNQNNTGSSGDYAQATFYALSNEHD